MKTHLLTLFLLSFAFAPFTQAQQVPQGMKYQAVARSLMGEILANQPVTLKISLNSKLLGSTKTHYSETHSVTTNALGLFDLTIGAGKVGTGTFKNVPWSTEDVWMEIAIQDGGKSGFSTVSSSRLLAVPYAFHAMTANELAGNPAARVAAAGPGDGTPSNGWSTQGNTRTDPATDRLGTMDNVDLIFVTNKIERLRITKDGDINIANSLKVGNKLTVEGASDLRNTLNVRGATTLNNTLNVDGNTTIKGVTNITPTTESISTTTGGLIVAGGVGISKNLNVGGATQLTNTLGVNGATTLKSTLSADGATTLKNTLGVDGATTLKSTLSADGATTLKNTLSVDKATTLKSTLSADGATTLMNTLSVEGATTLKSPLEAQGQVTITGYLRGEDSDYNSYSLRVQGSNQGIAVKVQGSRDNSTNFVTFWDSDGVQGRIEGQSTNELRLSEEFIFTNTAYSAEIATIAAEGLACGFQLDFGEVAVMVAQAIVVATQLAEYDARVVDNVGIAFESGSGDYAEWLEKQNKAEAFTYGDIVGVRGGKITKNTQDADHFMVVSMSPIVLGNMPKKGEEKNYQKTAFMGQVPVKVLGKVSIGDYIIPNGEHKGYGRAVKPDSMTLQQYRQIVGVAWSASMAKAPFSLVNVAVGINSNDLVYKMLKQQAELDEMKSKQNSIMVYLKSKDADFKEELYAVSSVREPAIATRPAAAISSTVSTPNPTTTLRTESRTSFSYDTFSTLFEQKPELLAKGMAMMKQQVEKQGADLNKSPELKRLLTDQQYLMTSINKIYGGK